MPHLIDTESRMRELVEAVTDVLVEHGAAGLTLRRIAARSGVNASSLRHHLGDRERVIRLVALHTRRRRISRLEARIPFEGVLAFLPSTDDQVVDARAWWGWLEVGRAEDSIDRAVAPARRDERALLAQAVDYTLQRDELDTLLATIDGLALAVSGPSRPMPRARARDLLARQLRSLGVADELARGPRE